MLHLCCDLGVKQSTLRVKKRMGIMNKQTTDFMHACYDMNSISELEDALNRAPDYTDMETWGISEDEYFDAIKSALDMKKQDISA